MKGKKIILILVLLLIIGGIVFVVINASTGKKEQLTTNATVTQKTSGKTNTANNVTNNTLTDNEKKETKITKLNDGTLYSLTDETIKPDIVIGDNYFDTQISDIYINFEQYEGKTIEIEGFYLYNDPYTFIGRYSEANLCPYCPVGYSYFEYKWDGDYSFNFTEEKEWLKITGTIKKGYDGVEYYYIDVLSLEVMNERGLDTVKN